MHTDVMSGQGTLSNSASGSSLKGELQNLLLREGIFTKKKIEEIQAHADRENMDFVKVLFFYGHISRVDYEALLRKAIKINKIDLLKEDIDFEILNSFDPTYLQNKLIFPVKIDSRGLILAMVNPLDKEAIQKIYSIIKLPIIIYYATDVDIQWALHKGLGLEIAKSAVYSLFMEDEKFSAIETFTLNQVLFIALMSTLLIIGLAFETRLTLVIVMGLINLFYLTAITFKFILTLAGARYELHEEISLAEVKNLREDQLPIYSILLPVYKEPEVIKILVEGLNKIDYPKDKLDIKLLLEEEDYATIDAVRKLDIPSHFECIVVPNMQPKTKPKACNYGLVFCTGKYVTIYDAEDIPDPDQLKKVIVAFNKYPKNIICIQAQLNYFNANENFLTRMFTLEYSYWFDYMLPGMDRLNVPIPLGGTSNHFDKEKLVQLNAWDPFNVTEDADLGIRAYAKGYRVGTINSTTYEEACKKIPIWIRQRSRWIKGYMQTFLVHMRNPIKLMSNLGFKGTFAFFMFIGGTPLTFLFNIPLWLLFFFWLIFKFTWISDMFPPLVLYISVFNLLLGNSIVVYMNMLAVFRRRLYNLVIFSFLNPLYWLLHSIASFKALQQLIFKPFYWEKTTHGLTTVSASNVTGAKK